jgi:hypothetical protein
MVNAWLPKLRPILEPACKNAGVPFGVAIGWIEVESGGHIGEVTPLGERGYFQLDPGEQEKLGLDPLRLSTDSAYSVDAGLKLIDSYNTSVLAAATAGDSESAPRDGVPEIRDFLLTPDATEYRFRLIKFFHSIGGGAGKIILIDAIKAYAADSWADLSSYALSRDEYYFELFKHRPSKWLGLVERMFSIGAPFGVGAPIDDAPAVA